jgi:hypothetical protein
MAREEINIGGQANDGTGDSVREAFDKVNSNFTEIYAAGIGPVDLGPLENRVSETENDINLLKNRTSDTETDISSIEGRVTDTEVAIDALIISLPGELTVLLNQIYPVGSIYINAGVTTNPATLLGFGTWVAFGAGRVMVGVVDGVGYFDTLGQTGGSYDALVVSHSHTASTASAGAHVHEYYYQATAANSGGGQLTPRSAGSAFNTSSAGAHTHSVTVDSTGSSGTNANIQPYITVAMWKRTA